MNFVNKILFLGIVLLFGSNLFAQHHLFFYIPECPNSTSIETIVQPALSVYPVPANDYVFVDFSESLFNDSEFSLNMYSANGKRVFSQTYKSNEKPLGIVQIKTKTFTEGVYYLQYINRYITRTKKIIITN
ncbi:MAG: T9SS type A sorting domain-containing protein [Bacteroidales bacterium]|nr:T9SS type A sorting domain-containing protein [Bacteroidales bacterium]